MFLSVGLSTALISISGFPKLSRLKASEVLAKDSRKDTINLNCAPSKPTSPAGVPSHR